MRIFKKLGIFDVLKCTSIAQKCLDSPQVSTLTSWSSMDLIGVSEWTTVS